MFLTITKIICLEGVYPSLKVSSKHKMLLTPSSIESILSMGSGGCIISLIGKDRSYDIRTEESFEELSRQLEKESCS